MCTGGSGRLEAVGWLCAVLGRGQHIGRILGFLSFCDGWLVGTRRAVLWLNPPSPRPAGHEAPAAGGL